MRTVAESYDVVVCGGGLAGFSAAIAAARGGAKTCLIQDRPVLGGNSSSEIRVTPHGAALCHAYARETGIISEVLIDERARNHQETLENGSMNSIWDMVLYDLAMTTPGLTLHVNTSIIDIVMDDAGETRHDAQVSREANLEYGYYHRPACNTSRRISAVVCRVNHAELELTVRGKIFIDSTGDGIVADLAGCEWRMGAEAQSEFDEPHGLPEASDGVMGSSIHFRAQDMGRPCPYQAPEWAVKHESGDYFKCHNRSLQETRGGFWWFEISAPWHTIHDNEQIRHELTRHVLGVWDWMKNHEPSLKGRIDNFALDWIGQVPGKRESRRIMGRYLMTENDALEKRQFLDDIAFGGWYVDIHEPGGLLLDGTESSSHTAASHRTFCGPYGIPLRMLMSKDLDNLMMAGRNISATHAALGTVRVMGTTALTGQACGTVAAIALTKQCELEAVVASEIQNVQQRLLRDGCFLLSHHNEDPADLARNATVSASSEASFSVVGPLIVADAQLAGHFRKRDHLSYMRSQWLFVSSARLESLGFFLTNESSSAQDLSLRIVPVDHIWDYRLAGSELPILAEATISVPANHDGWLDWKCSVEVPMGGYVRIDLLPNENLIWHTAENTIPGFPGVFEFEPNQFRRWHDITTSAFRVEPAQKAWPAGQVLSGVTRPYRTSNVWRSDATAELPQWIELRWAEPVRWSCCELTFPGNILKEYHKYPPFYQDPQTPSDYELQIMQAGEWRTLVSVQGNYQRRRVHNLEDAVATDCLRVVVTKTGGDPSAAIVEVRCYSE